MGYIFSFSWRAVTDCQIPRFPSITGGAGSHRKLAHLPLQSSLAKAALMFPLLGRIAIVACAAFRLPRWGGFRRTSISRHQYLPQVRGVCFGHGLHSERGSQLVPALLIKRQLPCFHNIVAGHPDVQRGFFSQ